VRLIGRDHDPIGQLLKGLENEETKGDREKEKEEKGCSVTRFADEQEYSKSIKEGWYADLKNDEVDCHFFPRKRRDRRLGRLVEEALAGVLGVLR